MAVAACLCSCHVSLPQLHLWCQHPSSPTSQLLLVPPPLTAPQPLCPSASLSFAPPAAGIVFIDEIDKIVTSSDNRYGGDASAEGVQRDLLPIIEGASKQAARRPSLGMGDFHAVCLPPLS